MSLKQKLSQRWQSIRQAANLMAGLPDYNNYVIRQRRYNPNAPVMSEQQFQDYCSKRRCGSNGGKCC